MRRLPAGITHASLPDLGHCRGHYDMQPIMDKYPRIERGSWQLPQYYELLRRGIAYCAVRA